MEWFHIFIYLLVLVFFYFLGYWTRKYLQVRNIQIDSLSTIEGSLLALFAFFLGFTFNISANKVETVRNESVKEANAIGTALLRSEMYEVPDQNTYRELFVQYLQNRIKYFEKVNSKDSITSYYKSSNDVANQIWEFTLAKEKQKMYPEASRLMIPAVNDMIDALSSRDSAINANLPALIINTLFTLSFFSCFIIGFGIKETFFSNLIGIIYIFIIALTVNMILDAGNPRSGFINTKKANHLIDEIYQDLQQERLIEQMQ